MFVGLFWKRLKNTVGEAFMPPGGEMFRFSETLGENVPVLGRHECLPYSKNAKRVEIYKQQFTGLNIT